jgi:hypothetical protein
MTDKREARRQRSALERQHREQLKRQQTLRSRAFVVAGALVILAIGVLLIRRANDSSGRVWSAEHGHWHDR